jgi:hypothetical protein
LLRDNTGKLIQVVFILSVLCAQVDKLRRVLKFVPVLGFFGQKKKLLKKKIIFGIFLENNDRI